MLNVFLRLLEVVAWVRSLIDLMPWLRDKGLWLLEIIAPVDSIRYRWAVRAVKFALLPSLLAGGGTAIYDQWKPLPESSGTIVYVDDASELVVSGHQTDIHSIAADGTKHRQFTYSEDMAYPSFTADGKWVYYSSRTTDGIWHIHRVNRRGEAYLCMTPDSTSDLKAPVASPDGKRLAFFSEEEGLTGIWLMDIKSREMDLMPEQDLELKNSDPAWSPDGRYLAHVETGESGSRVVVRDARSFKELGGIGSNKKEKAVSPAFSPDSSRLAVTYRSDTGSDVFIAKTAVLLKKGSTESNGDWFRTDHRNAASLRWSPDGAYLAYLAGDGGTWSLVVKNVRTNAATLVSSDAALRPCWDPKAKRVLFPLMSGGSGLFSLFEYDVAEDSRSEFLIEDNRWIWAPSASQDGTTVAYDLSRWNKVDDEWKHTVAIVEADQYRELKDGDIDSREAGSPSVSPDGSLVAYEDYDDTREYSSVRLVRDVWGEPETLVEGSDWYARPQFSQDGSRVVCAHRADGVNSVIEYSPDKKSTRQLTAPEDRADMPRLSPNGRYLAWVSSRSQHQLRRGAVVKSLRTVWVKDFWWGGATYELEIPVTADADVARVDWSPDGTWLVLGARTWDDKGEADWDVYVAQLRTSALGGNKSLRVARTKWLTEGRDPVWIAGVLPAPTPAGH